MFEMSINGDDGQSTSGASTAETTSGKASAGGSGDEKDSGYASGPTIATLLPPGQEGVRIPRGLDIEKFWLVLEECVQRADDANEALRAAAAATASANA